VVDDSEVLETWFQMIEWSEAKQEAYDEWIEAVADFPALEG
jgi:hypothetical protein